MSAPGQQDGTDLLHHVGGLLRARGERMTGPRKAVLTVLAQDGGHLGAEEVVTAVADVDATVHRASVYRALDALCDLGVVQHVHVGHGGTTYHLTRDSGAHVHAHCSRCGDVVDLPPDMLDAVAGRLARELGFRLDPTHVALSGVCARCDARRG